MTCIPKYLQNADLSDEDKADLTELHNGIYAFAEESGTFRKEEGKLYVQSEDPIKVKQAETFVNDLNKVYDAPISMLLPEGETSKLAVNTLALRVTRQNEHLPKAEIITEEPTHPHILSLFNGEKTGSMKDMLSDIAKRTDDIGQLAGKLLDHMPADIKANLLSKKETADFLKKIGQYEGLDDLNRLNAFYRPGNNQTYVVGRDNGAIDRTLVHEAIHGLTHHLFKTDAQFIKDFTRLYEKIKRDSDPGIRSYFDHEFSSPEEFLANAFTNIPFRDYLASKPTADNPTSSLWHTFRDWIYNTLSKVLGLEPAAKTALDDVLNSGNAILDNVTEVSQDTAADGGLYAELTSKKTEDFLDEMRAYENRTDKDGKKIGLGPKVNEAFNIIKSQAFRAELDGIRKDVLTTDGVSHLEELKKMIEAVDQKTTEGVKFEEAAVGLAKSVDQTTFLAKKLVDSLRNDDWEKLSGQETMRRIVHYTEMLNEWQTIADLFESDFQGSPILSDLTGDLSKAVREAKLLINDPHGTIGSIFKDAVVDRLTNLLAPTQSKIEAQYQERKAKLEEVIANKEKRGDTTGIPKVEQLIKDLDTDYKKFKIERSDVLDYLTGMRGDTNGLSAWFEAATNSPDPITAAAVLDLKNYYDVATEKAYVFDQGLQNAVMPLLKRMGIGKTNIFSFNKELVQEEEHLDGSKRLEFLNQFTGHHLALEKLDAAYNDARLSGDQDALLEAAKERQKFRADYMYQDLTPLAYKRFEYFADTLGQEAKAERDTIFDQINDIRLKHNINFSDQPDLSIDEEQEITQLMNEYRRLSSLKNPDGTDKTGDALAKAQRHKAYNDATREVYEWKPIEGEFEKRRNAYSQYLTGSMSKGSPEYQEAMDSWDYQNTRQLPTQEYYDTRQKLITELNALSQIVKDKAANKNTVAFAKGWEEMLDQTKGYRDVNNVPVGTEMLEGKLKAVKDQQEKMELLKRDIEKLNGLTDNENDQLQKLWAMLKAGMRLTQDQKVEKAALEQKQKDIGLDAKQTARYREIIQELQELSGRIPTDYYVDQLNQLSAKYGKVYDTETAIDLLTSNELEELRKHADFEKWFQDNHLQVEKFNEAIQSKEKVWERSYVWSTVVPMDDNHRESTTLSDGTKILGLPAFKYYERSVKDNYKTKKIVGLTVDNRGNYLPRGYDAAGNLLAKDDKFINRRYTEVQRASDERSVLKRQVLNAYIDHHLQSQELLPSNSRKLWLEVPRDQKSFKEMIQERDYKGTAFRAGEKLYRILPIPQLFGKNIVESSQTDLQNKEKANMTPGVRQATGAVLSDIPVKYTGKMDASQTSLDLGGAIAKYNLSIHNKAELAKAQPFLKGIEQILELSGYQKPDKSVIDKVSTFDPTTGTRTLVNKIKGVQSSDNYNRLDNIRNLQDKYFNGKYKRALIPGMDRGPLSQWVELNLINPIQRLQSIAVMAGNFPRAFMSSMSWNFYSLMDSISNRNFSTADFARSMSDFHTKILPSWIADTNHSTGYVKSLYGQLYDLYDPHHDVRHLIGSRYTSTTLGRASHSMWDLFINPTRMVQSQIGSSIMLSILRNTMVEHKGNQISLVDAYEKGSDGLIKLKDGITKDGKAFDMNQARALKERIRQAIRETQGNYGALDAARIEQYGIGQIFMFMHRYVVPLFADAWQPARFNINNGFQRGHQREIVGRFFGLVLSNLEQETDRSRLLKGSPLVEHNMRLAKGLTFIGSTVLFMALAAFLQGKKDPTYRNARTKDYLTTQTLIAAIKLQKQVGETTLLGAPGAMLEMAKNPGGPFFSALSNMRRILDDLGIEAESGVKEELGIPYKKIVAQGHHIKAEDPRVINSPTERRMNRQLYGTNKRLLIDFYKTLGIHSTKTTSSIPGTQDSKNLAAKNLVAAFRQAHGRAY